MALPLRCTPGWPRAPGSLGALSRGVSEMPPRPSSLKFLVNSQPPPAVATSNDQSEELAHGDPSVGKHWAEEDTQIADYEPGQFERAS